MAQQARPNVAGHIEFLRAHATALPSVLVSTPRRTSSSTSTRVWPVWTPATRSTGMASAPSRRGLSRHGALLVLVLARPALHRRRQPGAPGVGDALRPLPLEPALLPHVEIGHEHQPDEHHHLDQSEQAQA